MNMPKFWISCQNIIPCFLAFIAEINPYSVFKFLITDTVFHICICKSSWSTEFLYIYRYLSLYWMIQLPGGMAQLHMLFARSQEGLAPSQLQPGCLRSEANIPAWRMAQWVTRSVWRPDCPALRVPSYIVQLEQWWANITIKYYNYN